ncbi:putative uncharacterized protein [Aliivibrio wodanis]|uniref:Uncharacterized protein n=1 Tax=Aliivibrio wodanis TaxID=80852 RepID=A0A090IIH9_9GAMM|nr:putative uncharacterized protein [Aliivibrio wodanis]
MKIKLAAIARDEAAYLPEWIFHHLWFGFDEIEVYVNNTVDNSIPLLENIAQKHPVVITNADDLFEKSNGDFQFKAYRELAKKSKEEGFTHLLFLDIDEFWTPLDFETSIHKALEKLNTPQVTCFEWLLHCNEFLFMSCFEDELKVKRSNHVKSLFQLDAPFEKIGAHNIIGSELSYSLADGQSYDFGDDIHCAVLAQEHQLSPVKDFFVIHRMYRSELEYISLLGRGRPSSKKVKNNRSGYYKSTDKMEVVEVAKAPYAAYQKKWIQFVEDLALEKEIRVAQEFITARFDSVLLNAKSAPQDEKALYLKLFRGISLDQVQQTIHEVKESLKLSYTMERFQKEISFRKVIGLVKCKLLILVGKHDQAARYMLEHSLLDPTSVSVESNSVITDIDFALTKSSVKKNAVFYRDMAISLYKRRELDLAKLYIEKARQLAPRDTYICNLESQIKWELVLPKTQGC